MPLYRFAHHSGRIEAPFPLVLSAEALCTYSYFNPEIFSADTALPDMFEHTIRLLCISHAQPCPTLYAAHRHFPKERKPNNKVILACSGGLDSVYQAICLKEKGYDVTLFHVKNLNYYTNGKEEVITEDIAKALDMPLLSARFIADTRKDNPFRKYWSENSFKDMLFYSMMIDYAYLNDIYNISSGDDLSLDISKAVVGVNLSDAKQITETFMSDLKRYYVFNFIPTEQNHKGIRLQKLQEHGLLDKYYSCVNPGRFNQQNHKRIESCFGVELYHYNCGLCRKCAFHNLLRHYYLNEEFSPEFIDFCWDKIANGADNVFFNKKLPLEQRIKNLYEY